jgi:hypothetical protein
LTGPTNRTIDTVFYQNFDRFNVTTVEQGVSKKSFFSIGWLKPEQQYLAASSHILHADDFGFKTPP